MIEKTGSDWKQTPPFIELLGFRTIAAEAGSARVEVRFALPLTNRKGDVHGGVIAALLDYAMSTAIRSGISDFRGLSTINLVANYLAPARSDLVAEATLVKAGRSTGWANAEVRDAGGEIVATGSGTFRIIR